MRSLILLLLALLPWVAAHAQPDVMLRTNGAEVAGKVLSISPLAVRYVPAAMPTDTLTLAATDVFLIRYANGTRELLQAATPAPKTAPADPLSGLSVGERQARGRADAARSYQNPGAFWGSLGATLYGGPLLGAVAPATITAHAVAASNLAAPQPALLNDPVYNGAYRMEAQRTKNRRAWTGYGLGVGVWVVLIGLVVSSGW